ncbi:transposase [Stappia aggregata IAM 12614]|uniref:Transposase n=1 Tax=Roseibium aggregatum (strain ATCC 25650 / DSM 13394 / JCM 20685 / NBRC 16684 / NCIMB 2208 / IAM 12614 / B1) TaxID=384765 RepID=A0P2P3_ROSAI|nr:transposase [Stappia aggregata IAM 12614] [Roseibium aggregatum IAM 12614]
MERKASMTKETMIGIDLAKSVFQVHGASMSGQSKFRRKLTRQHFRRFMADQVPAMVVMEACGSAHYWAREMAKLGHEVRLIAPQYVRPFVKRKKNDAADAEAIVIAAQRPEIRQLKRGLARVTEERDILKKAAAYFAKDAK